MAFSFSEKKRRVNCCHGNIKVNEHNRDHTKLFSDIVLKTGQQVSWRLRKQ